MDIHLTFQEPFRATDRADGKNGRQRNLRGLSFAVKQGDKIFIPGTLVRSALLKEVEFLLALNGNAYDCCPGLFSTPSRKGKERRILRRRSTYRFSKRTDRCSEEDPCLLCILLGRFDKKDTAGNKSEFSVHFSNFNPLHGEAFEKTGAFAGQKRILNRVDFFSGKGKDYFKVWEVDNELLCTFSGSITLRNDIKKRSEVEGLLGAGLAKINVLCGALCRVDIVQNGSTDLHQGLIARFFSPKETPEDGDGEVDTVPTATMRRTSAGPLFEKDEKAFSKDEMGRLAQTIKQIIMDSGKESHLRRLADAVRELRRHGPEELKNLPETTKGGSATLWSLKSGSSTVRGVMSNYVEGHKISDWRGFCEALGEAIYEEEKKLKNRAEALPRLLGDTEYYGQPSLVHREIALADPETLPAYEWIINGTLRAETPFHFGKGSSAAQTSAAVVLDSQGRYRIPRSVLRGALRRDLREEIGTGCEVELGGATPCQCDVCRIMRRITVMDARSQYAEPPEIRHRNRMNQKRGIVDEGALFDMELGPEGLTFRFRLYLRADSEDLDANLYMVLERWHSGMGFLGGDTGIGKGRFKFEPSKVFLFNHREANHLKLCMIHRGFVDCSEEQIESYLPRSERSLKWQEASSASAVESQRPAPWQRYEYKITFDSPVLSNDPIAAMLEKDNPDTSPVRKRVLEYDGTGRFKEKEIYVIKGEGVRGIVRTAVGKNLVHEGVPLHDMPHDDCECVLCCLFGSEHHQGLLRFEDAHFIDTPESQTLDHVAIDRLSGGARDKFKYDDSPLIGTPGKPLRLKGIFWVKRELHDASQNLLSWEDQVEGQEGNAEVGIRGAAGSLWKAFQDLKDGLFPIGSNGGIGYGWVSDLKVYGPDGEDGKGILERITNSAIDLCDSRHPRAGGNPEKRTVPGIEKYTPPKDFLDTIRDTKNVFYPHYFLKPNTYVNRIPDPVTHETYHQARLTGKMTCRLTTLGPVFVPDTSDDNAFPPEKPATEEERKEGRYHKSYRFFRLNNELLLPGSEIRGMISAVYEAITNSCFRVINEEKILSNRMKADPKKVLSHYKPGKVVRNGKGELVVQGPMRIVRVPVYNSSAAFFHGLTEKQIDGKDPVNLWVKEKEWRVSISDPGNHLTRKRKSGWLKTEGSIQKLDETTVWVDASYDEEKRVVEHTTDQSDKKILDRLSAEQRDGREPVGFWLRTSQYQKAFRNKPDDNGGWKNVEGYLHITGPNKVEIDSSGVPPGCLPGIPKQWRDVQCNRRGGKEFKAVADKTVYTMNKYCETFFYNEGESPKEFAIPRTVLNQYNQMITDSIDNPQKPPSIFRSKPIRDKDRALHENDLVYYRKTGEEVEAIVPVRIYRESHKKPIGYRFPDGLDNLRPCTFDCLDDCEMCPKRCEKLKEYFSPHPKGLCPACRLFGTTSYRGRVSFGFARLANPDGRAKWYRDGEGSEDKPFTLPLQEIPRLTWVMPNKASKIPGRKFYVHHPHSVKDIKGEEKTPNNRTIEPLDKGNAFEFEVRFSNLEEWELGLLLYSLQLEEGLAHKLGMGKALGFGSVKIEAKEVVVREEGGIWNDQTSRVSDWVSKGKETLQGGEWFNESWDRIRHIEDLRKLLWFPSDYALEPKVRYPSLKREDDKRDGLPGYIELKGGVQEDSRITALTTPWVPWYPLSTQRAPEGDGSQDRLKGASQNPNLRQVPTNPIIPMAPYLNDAPKTLGLMPTAPEEAKRGDRQRLRLVPTESGHKATPSTISQITKRGNVKWYDSRKGYGFLVPAEGGSDVFFHRSAIKHVNQDALQPGQEVSYTLTIGDKGPVAVEIGLAARR